MQDSCIRTSPNHYWAKFAERTFYELRCTAFSLSRVRMIDTTGNLGDGPAFRSPLLVAPR
jgi:hypothetical protein